ncbi:CAP domain [Plasmopara halstedii]|uniref:CAP domain n=1 Tax=Plasmopara halstedii TaxID=4781 RepID=A0A0P1AAC9_PLAHL|nr:CAP domain [Plasmopara halstedii]CEG37713.1 CAP domain [Plasmopara halstedii]|eukprot:XP_024574082.1 CAP domain [Plasmopara halstedii]
MPCISGSVLFAAFVVTGSVTSIAYGFQPGSGGRVMWEDNCDFTGNDYRWMRAIPNVCGDVCADDIRCTHWAWNNYAGGTCWFKTGTPSAKITKWSTNCGYVVFRAAQSQSQVQVHGQTSNNGLLAAEGTDMLLRINNFRSQNGLPGLSIDNRLVSAATLHSQDQARNCRMSHTGSNGSGIGDRAMLQNYNFNFVAENVASGQKTVDEVMTAWMNSPSHRANLLSKDVRHVGFAKAVNNNCNLVTYWTQDFGRLA